ncbi:MAG: hypothetical protein Q9187_004624 [Circinaria calcarea]
MGHLLSGSSRIHIFWIWLFHAIVAVQATPLVSNQCASVADVTNSTTLLDQDGVPTTNQSQAWGISYEACNTLCGSLDGPSSFDWSFFSQGLSQWLLPWLALTAQLPFETKDRQGNFMALLLAVGSPALVVYSLALTILNSRSINREFRQIRENNTSDIHPQQAKVIKAARAILIESQHVPIQVYNGPNREIAQLIVDPGNWAWWCNLQKEIRKTKRKWTYSLYIQVAWVCLSQFWAIVAFFTSAVDNTVISNALAINCLWIWMIPVVLGWVYVGTQCSAGSIKAALTSVSVPNIHGECIGIRDRTIYNNPRIRLATFFGSDDPYKQEHIQDGMTTESQRLLSGSAVEDPVRVAINPKTNPIDLNSQPLRTFSSFEPCDESPDQLGCLRDIELVEYINGRPKTTNTIPDVEQQPQTLLEEREHFNSCSHTFLGFPITGADLQPGPIYNYARFWSHMNAVNHVVTAFALVRERQRRKQTVNRGRWNSAQDQWERNLNGSPEMMSKYISADYKDVADIPVHVSQLPLPVMNCILAAFVAIILQWGSVGSALLVAYRYLLPCTLSERLLTHSLLLRLLALVAMLAAI